MAHIWQKHSFRLLLYLEWILLGIALLASFGFAIRPRSQFVAHPHLYSLTGGFCIILLGIIGLRLPRNSKLFAQAYIAVGLILSWLGVLLLGRSGRVFPVLLLIVVIRACLLFSWKGRIFVAITAYTSYLALQVMSFMRISPFGIPLGRSLPRALRRLPPEELRRVWFNLAFNSALLFAFVLAFVLLLVGAILAEYESRAKLVKANKRLRDYALRIENQATVEERNRIAREIHDSVGHYLTAQSIQLENTALFLEQDIGKAATHLDKARKLGREALANIRSSVATLRKEPTQKRSLEVTIEELVTNFQINTNIAIAWEVNLPSSLTFEVSTALYRIVQEALTNITKHSQATKVDLHLEKVAEKILLSIKDNGCGFDPNDNTTGFGLQGMQERTKALNGKLELLSKNGQGCEIRAEIPFSAS